MPDTNVIDHMRFSVADFARARAFYVAALAPLEIVLEREFSEETTTVAGFGKGGRPYFFIASGEAMAPRLHLAFGAASHAEVDAFYEAAVAAGGKDNGKPGLRRYHPTYYGAFVLDPDGHNIEAVCHSPA